MSNMEKAKVYMTQEITPEALIRMYEQLQRPLPGKVAVKVHSRRTRRKSLFKTRIYERFSRTCSRNDCRMQYSL